MKRTVLILWMLVLLLSACGEKGREEPAQTEDDPRSTSPVQVPEQKEPVVSAPTAHQEPVFDGAALAGSMTLEEQVGQLFLARCPESGGVEDVQKYHLGGYILFARDFERETPESAAANIAAYQAAAAVPLLIAVDEEGGSVTRVSSFPQYRDEKFSSPRTLYAEGGLPAVVEEEKEKCRLLGTLGINVNMAPVCDITTDRNAFIYDRSLGESPERTAEFVSAVLAVTNGYRMGSVLKHFPGYGNNEDTHVGIVRDERSQETLEAVDLVPFVAGIEKNCGAILMSHTVVDCLDSEYPVSLSEKAHRYVREEMGFDGVLVTDDLVMQAVTDLYGTEEAAVLAVLAGNDLLCSSEYAVQYEAVLEAARSGRIPAEQIEQAAGRVLQ